MKLTEGETYKFTVIKQVLMPEEGEFFLIRHHSGRRLMLPVETYKHYAIKPDKVIECRVDKINCTGKIFLEPMHPFYKEGDIYSFEIVDIVDENGTTQLIVKDCFNNNIPVEWEGCYNLDNQQKVELLVDRVKKGIPQLQCPTKKQKEHEWSSLVGKELDFKVEKISINSKNENVYILNNENVTTYVKVRHYAHYGFSIGDIISCRVYGISTFGKLKVEPKNPFYKVDGIYSFTVSSIEKNSSSGTAILVVHDYCNNKCGVQVSEENLANINKGVSIKCRVIGFRKGRPNLKLETLG